MLGVGIDWSEEFHLVALGPVEEGVIEVRRVEHTPAAVAALVAQIAGMDADPGEVRVVIETGTGCWWRRWSTPATRCCRSTPI